jgi:hypothetical protein
VALIALASAKGAPGVTTSALALTLQWPRPVLLVEADLAGSSIMAGFFKAQVAHDRGLVPLAIAHSRGQLAPDFWDQTLPLIEGDADKKLLPGLPSASAAPSVFNLWRDLSNHLVALERGGVDVIVDLGRLAPAGDDREFLVSLADQVLITTGSRLPDIAATRDLVSHRMAGLESAARDLTNLSVLTVGPGRPYAVGEITETLGIPSAGHLGWDPVNAEVLSVGASANERRYERSPLVRSVRPTIDAIQARIALRRERFTVRPEEAL